MIDIKQYNKLLLSVFLVLIIDYVLYRMLLTQQSTFSGYFLQCVSVYI